MTNHSSTVKLNRATPIWLLVIFLAPLFLATLFVFFHDSLPIAGKKNRGELITPARPIEQFSAKTDQGESLTLDFLKGKWTLLQVGAEVCDLYCQANLFKTRQARLAQGENLARIQRLYLLPAGYSIEKIQSLFQEHPRMTVALIEESTQDDILKTLGDDALGKVFLIDPLGNAMMRYSNDNSAKDIVKDLQHLLRASRIG